MTVGEDVDPEATTVDQGSEQTRTSEPVEVRTRLGQTQPTAVDVADEEVAADRGVHVDATSQDVASDAGEVKVGVAGGEVLQHRHCVATSCIGLGAPCDHAWDPASMITNQAIG